MQIHLPPTWAIKAFNEEREGRAAALCCTLWTDLPPGLVPLVFSSSLRPLGLFKEKASNFCPWFCVSGKMCSLKTQ